MGSQLLKNYNVEKDSFLTAGYNNYWKVYKGSHKERKMDVSVFVFEKKNLEKYSNKEEIMNVLRKEAQTLAKYKHPNILSLVEPLLEDKQSIIFVTEPISYSVTSWIESTSPSKLEIKVLITEICNSILFLHDDAKVVHLSVNPDCIFLNDKTQIKLSGFNFSITDPSSNIIDFKLSNLTPNALPVLKYTAPEVVLDNKCGYSSDVFSIGALIYNLLRIHKGDTERDLIGMSNNEVHSYKSCFENVSIRLQRSFSNK
jgi:SCY1-like protein 2